MPFWLWLTLGFSAIVLVSVLILALLGIAAAEVVGRVLEQITRG